MRRTASSVSGRAPWPVLVSLVSMLTLGCHATARAEGPMQPPGAVNPRVADPGVILGYAVGERAATYEELVRVCDALVAASDRVTRTDYGRSHEGRTLFYLTITDPANHARLTAIQQANARRADPRQGDAPELNAEPVVAWLDYGIHGDELSSTDAALHLAWRLAAGEDPKTRAWLRDTVIHIVPLVNPDGRERFLGQIRQFTGQVPNPDFQGLHHGALWTRGRGNHYLFDLNRDWLILEQPEIRGLGAAIRDWSPQFLVDSHEMYPNETYLFDPPSEPTNRYLNATNIRWRTAFGADQARAFDRRGWSYYTRDWYSDWAPIYTNAWASLRDAIGLLYEQARADSGQVKYDTGHIMTYRDTVEHHVVSTLTNLETLHRNRTAILRDFVAARRAAVTPADSPLEVFLLPPHPDTDRRQALLDLLQRQGIELRVARASVTAHNVTTQSGRHEATRTLPAGTAVVAARQPLRNLLTTLLDFDPRLGDAFLQQERQELEKGRDSRLYDTTAWSLSLGFGLEAIWAQTIDDTPLDTVTPPPTPAPVPAGAYAYLIDGARTHSVHALARLLAADCRVRAATRPFRLGDHDYPVGTLLLRGHENAPDLHDRLNAVQRITGVPVTAVTTGRVQDGYDLGSGRFGLLQAPRTGLLSRWPIRTTSFGSLWYLLDARAGIQVSPLNVQSLAGLDLRPYNVLILPDSGGLDRILGEGERTQLRRWVEAGGTLVAVGGSAAYLAQADVGLSAVRLRRDVLEDLPAYAEAVARERAARHVQVDPNALWAGRMAVEPNTAPSAQGDAEARQRRDQWQRRFSPPGAFLATHVDTEHWLAAGLDADLPLYLSGPRAFLSRAPVQTVARFEPAATLRASGLLWPEARARLADSAAVTVERLGRGQVILFATDPSFRLWMPAAQRLLLNAVLLGPGLGTDPPRPW